MVDTVWVLERAYRLAVQEIVAAIERILRADVLVVENEQEVFTAMIALKEGQGSFGVRRAYYGTLCAVAALAMIVRYRRERALVSNRLLVDAFVTDWGKPWRSRSRFVDFFLARLSGNIPVMKYSFVAFDQKTYTGETGWGALGLF
jgi:hypothetical protein